MDSYINYGLGNFAGYSGETRGWRPVVYAARGYQSLSRLLSKLLSTSRSLWERCSFIPQFPFNSKGAQAAQDTTYISFSRWFMYDKDRTMRNPHTHKYTCDATRPSHKTLSVSGEVYETWWETWQRPTGHTFRLDRYTSCINSGDVGYMWFTVSMARLANTLPLYTWSDLTEGLTNLLLR